MIRYCRNDHKWIFYNFQEKTVTLTFCQGHPVSHYFKIFQEATFWPSFITILTIVFEIHVLSKLSKMDFINFQVKTVPLIKGQGHSMSHHFEGLFTGYVLAKFHNYTFNE